MRENLYAADMKQVQHAWESGNARAALSLLETQRPKSGEADLRGFEWRYFWKVARGEQAVTLGGNNDPVSAVSFGLDGQSVISVGRHGLRIWDSQTYRLLGTLPKELSPPVTLSHDGQLLASTTHGLVVWRIKSPKEISLLWNEAEQFGFDSSKFSPSVDGLAFSMDGKLLASAAAWPRLGT
jgi:WD40 repeat protein